MPRIATALFLLIGTPGLACAAEPAPASLVIEGKISPHKSPDGKGDGLALVTAKGVAHPIVQDASSRLLFLDLELPTRTLRLTVTPQAGTRAVKVTKVQSVKGTVVHDVDYWCENCQMSYAEPGQCICCGGETVLRERPIK
jgi:hypothetical protein